MPDPRSGLFDEWENWFNPESGTITPDVDYTPREVAFLWTPIGTYEIDMDARPLIGFYLREDEYEDEEE